jgi:TatD DNase family protein
VKWYDAHNHLHDPRLAPVADEIASELERLPLSAAVVNGTSELDWPAVREWAARRPWVVPAFGLHPWYVQTRSPQWREALVCALDQTPGAVIGEIGLDRWVEGFDLPAQLEVFEAQLALAAERNLPASIHCLKAWGALEERLCRGGRPACGFLLHSYGGPAEMVAPLASLGAYFSFSPYFLHPRKAAAREVFQQVPLDRLLVETDAPDMFPPPERNPHPLTAAGRAINHPLNLEVAYAGLAELREMTVDDLASAVEANFQRLFGKVAPVVR